MSGPDLTDISVAGDQDIVKPEEFELVPDSELGVTAAVATVPRTRSILRLRLPSDDAEVRLDKLVVLETVPVPPP